MADEKIEISIGDLCTSLINEFAISLDLVRRSHPTVVVQSAKLRLGQVSDQELDSPTETDTRPQTLLLSERYPFVKQGWELELELGEKASAKYRPDNIQIPLSAPPRLLDLVADNPLTDIDGISTRWSEKLAGFGLYRIKDLARIDNEKIVALCRECRSVKVREFRKKVVLLNHPLPFLTKSGRVPDLSIDVLLLLTPGQLQQALGASSVSAVEVEALIDVFDLLALALNEHLLRKLTLRQIIGV